MATHWVLQIQKRAGLVPIPEMLNQVWLAFIVTGLDFSSLSQAETHRLISPATNTGAQEMER